MLGSLASRASSVRHAVRSATQPPSIHHCRTCAQQRPDSRAGGNAQRHHMAADQRENRPLHAGQPPPHVRVAVQPGAVDQIARVVIRQQPPQIRIRTAGRRRRHQPHQPVPVLVRHLQPRRQGPGIAGQHRRQPQHRVRRQRPPSRETNGASGTTAAQIPSVPSARRPPTDRARPGYAAVRATPARSTTAQGRGCRPCSAPIVSASGGTRPNRHRTGKTAESGDNPRRCGSPGRRRTGCGRRPGRRRPRNSRTPHRRASSTWR